MEDEKSGSNPFDWGGLFQVVGMGVNAAASIHSANKNVQLAKEKNSLQLQLSGNQRFTSLLAAMTEQRKNGLQVSPIIIVAVVIVLILLFVMFDRRKIKITFSKYCGC